MVRQIRNESKTKPPEKQSAFNIMSYIFENKVLITVNTIQPTCYVFKNKGKLRERITNKTHIT